MLFVANNSSGVPAYLATQSIGNHLVLIKKYYCVGRATVWLATYLQERLLPQLNSLENGSQ